MSSPVSFKCVSLLWCCAFALLFPFNIGFAGAQMFPCYTELTGLAYNLSSLSGTQISGYDADKGWKFFLNMCGVAPACKRDGAMACQVSQADGGTTLYAIAYPNDDVAPHFWNEIPGGIQLDAFGSGQWCTSPSEGNERKAIVQVLCDPSITGMPTNFSAAVVENPLCTYTMKFSHSSACGYPIVNTTIPPVPSAAPCSLDNSVDHTKVTGAGFGVGLVAGAVLTGAIGFAYVFLKRRTGNSKSKWNKFDDDKDVNMASMNTETPRGETTN